MKEIILSIVIVTFLSGISYTQPFALKKKIAKENYTTLSCPNGRFVFGQISDSSKDQYMLDTWTGRLWRLSENSQVGKFLLPVPYQKKNGLYSALPEQIPKKK